MGSHCSTVALTGNTGGVVRDAQGARCGFVGFFGLVVIPLLVGLFFDAAITLPVRVPWLDQCPAPNPLFQVRTWPHAVADGLLQV